MMLSDHLPFSVKLLKQFCDKSFKDPSFWTLMNVVLTGWPQHKKYVPLEVYPYFICQNDLSIQDDFFFLRAVSDHPNHDVSKKVHSSWRITT